jgi:hypothetical protein
MRNEFSQLADNLAGLEVERWPEAGEMVAVPSYWVLNLNTVTSCIGFCGVTRVDGKLG